MSEDLFDIFNEDAPLTEALAGPTEAEGAVLHAGPAESEPLLSEKAVGAASPPLTNTSRELGLMEDIVLYDGGDDALQSPATTHLHQVEGQTDPLQSEAVNTPRLVHPLPLPFPNDVSSSHTSPSSNKAVMIIHSAPPSNTRCGNGGGEDDTIAPSPRVSPPASAVFTEQHSRIRVRRATAAFEQLAIRFAEFPFASFASFRQAACHSSAGSAPVPRTCVGVVSRKSDPKQSTGQSRSSRYAVFSMWSMDSISPTPESEISFLLCGDAFELLYSHLVRGSVVALSNVGTCSRKGGSGSSPTGYQSQGGVPDVLLRVADHTTVRQLGFAADLGTCASVSYKSKERCQVVVNTLLSKHCSYHVGDLRKVVRGTAGGGASSASGSALRTPATVPHPSTAAVMKGGALTSHMTLSSAAGPQRGTLLAARGTPLRSTVSGLAATSMPQPANARVVATQQLLRQPSFFAVRGASGLPVEDAALRRGLTSAGTGVYGGVHTGAPLPLAQKVGLRPSARYPSSQELGVTSRGRDALEAARRQAVMTEEEMLLRRSLRPTAATRPAEEGGSKESCKVNAATTRVRARDPHTELASAAKRTRTDGVPSPARLAAPAPSSSPSPSSTVAAATVDASRIEALRMQFQPLHRGSPAAFTPLSGQSSVHTVISSAVQKDYRHSVVYAGNDGGHNAQTALLRAAAKAAKDVPSQKSNGASAGAVSLTSSSSSSSSNTKTSNSHSSTAPDEALPLTLLGTVASGVRSQHDHLRGEADRQRLLSFVDKQITKEKALEALEAVSQQAIKAYYCYGCRCWYGKPPTTCAEQHHRTELKPALKKYIKCEHCHYKTFIIGGEDAKGWKVFPKCPRCHEASYWVRGDAAPQVASLVEEPSPL